MPAPNATLLTALALSILIGGTALGQSYCRLGGPVEASGWTGEEGETRSLGSNSDFHAVREIVNVQHGGVPCTTGAWLAPLPGTGLEEGMASSSRCRRAPDDEIAAGLPARAMTGLYIAELSVCLTGDSGRDRLAGLRAGAARVDAACQVQVLSEDEAEAAGFAGQSARAGCVRWSEPARCPAGMVAAGVEIGYWERSATGLRLLCRPVERVQSPAAQGGGSKAR